MMKIAVGLTVGLLIGAGCRWFDLPLPGPPKFVGVLLIAAITLGYIGTDKLITRRLASNRPESMKYMCGGPTGELVRDASVDATPVTPSS